METKNNNNISSARLWKYTWANIYINRKTLLLESAATVVCVNIIYWWITTSELIKVGGSHFAIDKIGGTFLGFIFLTVTSWIIMTGNLLSDYHKKGMIARSFLLPVSQDEQWLSHIFYSWIRLLSTLLIQALIFLLWIWSNDGLDILIENVGFWHQMGLFKSFFSLSNAAFVLFSWALFLIIGTLFARKRILISLLTWGVLTYIISYGVNSVYDLLYWNGDVSIDYSHTVQRIVSIVQSILAVGFVALSYVCFKRLQINR